MLRYCSYCPGGRFIGIKRPFFDLTKTHGMCQKHWIESLKKYNPLKAELVELEVFHKKMQWRLITVGIIIFGCLVVTGINVFFDAKYSDIKKSVKTDQVSTLRY